MERIGVIGSGTWGTAIAILLSHNGHEVTLWSAIPSEIEELEKTRRHPNLPEAEIPKEIQMTVDLKEAMEERDKIISEARQQAEKAAQKELDLARQQIQAEKEEAIRDIRRQVALLSVDIAEKVLRKSLDSKEAQMDMIDRMLDEVTNNKN